MNPSAGKVEKFKKLGTKKPYESPKLVVYGSLAEMTRKIGPRGKFDGGNVHSKKFASGH
jgi:hypothetical protein